MNKDLMDNYLQTIKNGSLFDNEIVDKLINSHMLNETGEETAQKIISIIDKRYAEDKKNKT